MIEFDDLYLVLREKVPNFLDLVDLAAKNSIELLLVLDIHLVMINQCLVLLGDFSLTLLRYHLQVFLIVVVLEQLVLGRLLLVIHQVLDSLVE